MTAVNLLCLFANTTGCIKLRILILLTLLSFSTYLFLSLNVREEGSCCTLSHSKTDTSIRTPLDEGSARRRDLYLTTHNTNNRQTSVPPAGFEPAITASERPQTQALYRAATGIGTLNPTSYKPSIILQIQSVNANLPPCPIKLSSNQFHVLYTCKITTATGLQPNFSK